MALGERINNMYDQIGNFTREIKNARKDQLKMLETKNTGIEKKNTFHGRISRPKQRISHFGDRTI